jgi:hypothetical protein
MNTTVEVLMASSACFNGTLLDFVKFECKLDFAFIVTDPNCSLNVLARVFGTGI